MGELHRLDDVPAALSRAVVTIGTFDGVHRGHAALVQEAVAAARSADAPCVALTFDPHPLSVVAPQRAPDLLCTVPRRAELLGQLGVDGVCVAEFTEEFAGLGPEEFIDQVLVGRLQARGILVGSNFTFGRRASGDVALLRRAGVGAGFSVDAVGLVGGAAPDDTLSATSIRRLVAAGDVTAAASALGRPHRVDGVVVVGDRRGRELGYPTANLDLPDHTAIPADGVYGGWVWRLDDAGRTGDRLAAAAISVGTNPTFDGTTRRVEAHLLEFDGDLYGDRLGVEFTHRIRGMVRFESVAALIEQMGADVAQVATLLS